MVDVRFSRYCPEDLRGRLPADVVVGSWMLTDGGTASALWILSTFAPWEARVWSHVGYSAIDFEAMVAEEGWSPTELVLVRAAAGISGRSVRNVAAVDLGEAIERLDDERWYALMRAVAIRREKLRG